MLDNSVSSLQILLCFHIIRSLIAQPLRTVNVGHKNYELDISHTIIGENLINQSVNNTYTVESIGQNEYIC